MEIKENLARIKDNLLLIPEARFDSLSQDSYKDSFVYLLGILILGIPFTFLVSLFQGASLFAILIAIPIALVINIVLFYIYSGFIHIVLKLLGGKASLPQTIAVLVHGSTLFVILSAIPLLSLLLALLMLANQTIGAKRVHNVSLLRAIVAVVVIPVLLFIIIIVVLTVIAMMFLTSTMAAMSGAYG